MEFCKTGKITQYQITYRSENLGHLQRKSSQDVVYYFTDKINDYVIPDKGSFFKLSET